MIDYLFFGFSISEQGAGYFSEIERPGVELRALGGFAFDALPALAPFLSFDKARHVILEIASCRRFAGKDASVYEHHLSLLCDAVCSAGSVPAFFNLPRRNLGADVMETTIRDFAKRHGFACVSLCNGPLSPSYVRDGTHTTPEGSAFYAKKALELIDQIESSPRPAPFRYVPPDGRRPIWISAGHDGVFSRRGISIPTCVLDEGQSVEIEIPNRLEIESVIPVFGQTSGRIQVEANGESRTLLCHDGNSYYSRLATLRCPMTGTIRLTQLPGRPPIPLKKGTPREGPRRGEVAGFIGFQLTQAALRRRELEEAS
jgi:hypothetical protein